MASLEVFLKDLQRFADVTVPKAAERFVRKVATAVLEGVVERTPVRIGRAKGNWQVTVGGPSTAPTDHIDPIGDDTVERGKVIIDNAPVLKSPIYITNNVEYIDALEHGSSSQAPAGMMQVTVDEVKAKVDAGAIR